MEVVLEWLELFKWSWVCIWEEITGQEVSCPPCWKCEASRYFMLAVVLIAAGVVTLVVAS